MNCTLFSQKNEKRFLTYLPKFSWACYPNHGHFSSLTLLNPFALRDEEDTAEMSLFETLRETIYSEVATLISQNENRPHYLIELFRELQLLTTDYLRQRVLYDIKDVISKYLVEENSVSAVSILYILC